MQSSHLGECVQTQLPHIGLKIFAQNVAQMGWSLCPQCCKCKVKGPPQHDKICSQRQGAQNVQSAFNAAVKDQRQRGGGAQLWQHFDRGGGGVKLAPGVV